MSQTPHVGYELHIDFYIQLVCLLRLLVFFTYSYNVIFLPSAYSIIWAVVSQHDVLVLFPVEGASQAAQWRVGAACPKVTYADLAKQSKARQSKAMLPGARGTG